MSLHSGHCPFSLKANGMTSNSQNTIFKHHHHPYLLVYKFFNVRIIEERGIMKAMNAV
jgi:hypothetical protein